MSSELIVRSTRESAQIALLEAKQLVEFHEEHYADKFNVGDIFLGRVRKVVSSLNAAFVNIGHNKDAFLHYLDMGTQYLTVRDYVSSVRKGGDISLADLSFKEELEKDGKLSAILSKDDVVLMQISKVPIAQKGSRISGDLSLSGRYLILKPFNEGVSVSKRITQSKERNRLLQLVRSICPKNYGIIVRTAADGASVADLHKDLKERLNAWETGMKNLQGAEPGQGIIREERRSLLVFRDLLGDSLESLYVDSEALYKEVMGYVQNISPEKAKIVRLYEGKIPVFEHFGVDRQLRSSFGRHVRLPGGGALVIDPTEALHVIDVNSGKNVKGADQESNALRVNLNAVPEISRQIRLRDLGGIIVVDFIDMRNKEHRTEVQQAMEESMSKDRSKYTILPLTKFGLMQLTRHRVRPAIRIDNSETCPSCSGSGKVANVLAIGELIGQHIDYLFTRRKERSLHITLHPYLYAYFTKGFLSTQLRWRLKYRRKVHLLADHALGITSFRFQDYRGDSISLD